MNGKKRLFSHTTQIEFCNPYEFYNINQAQYKGQRFFWRSPDGETFIVGLGVSASISNSSSMNRFDEIDQQWKRILKTAIIDNSYNVIGTGPLLFGGFSFDTESIKMSEWDHYGESLFYLPKIMLTFSNNRYYITMNHFLESAESKGYMEQDLKEFVQQLTTTTDSAATNTPHIKDMEEINVEKWVNSVKDIVNILKSTEMKKVVLARKLKVSFSDQPSSTYILQQLADQQQSSFIFSMEAEDGCFLGASPERLVKITGTEVLSTCLAGSTRRGKDEEDDRNLGEGLLNDPKNLFEHELVVSMIEDALRPYCNQLSIPGDPILMKTPYIQHLYTPVVGKINKKGNIFSLVKDLHPTPALGGVPRKPAMKLIRENEEMDRGFYGSPIGWTDFQGNGEFIVGIRSGLLKGNSAYLYAGCGLVSDSVAEKELRETRVKFKPMLNAIGGKEI
ncbi:isochorismate synthase [Bacillus niameyensis]|uniref:isochorismate synthase n=1 Tax=Bacillus niameyensis TaxID=1522308 RepID=UPI000781F985|nr:isochorismate synthase [Bacillus niameyensis]